MTYIMMSRTELVIICGCMFLLGGGCAWWIRSWQR